MVKGFKDDSGKFHPTVGMGSRSSREKTIIPRGMLNERRRLKFAPEGEIAPLSDVRTEGNEIIEKVIDVMKESHPDKANYIIHNTSIYNDYDNIQKTFFYSKDNVEKLLEWRQDPSPDTWKWKIPLWIESPENQIDLFQEDNHNRSFIEDAYKGKVTIAIMSPRDYIKLACPNCLEDLDIKGIENLDFDLRGKEHTDNTIKEIENELKRGNKVDTVFLNISGNEVRSHEGRHRAFGALKAGLEQIPVYIYSSEPMEDDFRERITNDPISELIPDIPVTNTIS